MRDRTDMLDDLRGLSGFDHVGRTAIRAADEIERLRAEVASLRLTLGGKTFGPDIPEPIGCPMPGACAQVAEIARLRRGWLRAIQQENSCSATGVPCKPKKCACALEQNLLKAEWVDPRQGKFDFEDRDGG